MPGTVAARPRRGHEPGQDLGVQGHRGEDGRCRGTAGIERGKGDQEALARAIETLRAGACIGVFPEGTRSKGKVLRARSGIGRLALEVPEAHVSLVAIEGTTDLTGFPRRPRIGDLLVYPNTAGYQMDSNESRFHDLALPPKVVIDRTEAMTDSPITPSWTDHDVSDPGVTLLEALAYAIGAAALIAVTTAVIRRRRRRP